MTTTSCLSDKMRALAADRPGSAKRLIEAADNLDIVVDGYFCNAEHQTHTAKQFLSAYAKARLLWCEVTGEPLV